MEKQKEANYKLFEFAESLGLVKDGSLSATSTGGERERIIHYCMEKWEEPAFDTYDFSMVVFCVGEQFSAYNRIKPSSEKAAGTVAFCADKWPNDYIMREDCLYQQLAAHKKLFTIAESDGILAQNGTIEPKATANPREKLIYDCLAKWRYPLLHTYDFMMVMFCIEPHQ